MLIVEAGGAGIEREVKAVKHRLAVGITGLTQARFEFQRAHQRAKFRSVVDRLLRRCGSLCSLRDAAEEAGRELSPSAVMVDANGHAKFIPSPARLQEVDLDMIIGSLGRAEDYTADFLPRLGSDEERWARVRLALDSLKGVPPIELYEYEGEYYVKDGHHRVSVMKRVGFKRVEAYVTRLVPVRREDHALIS